MSPFSLLDNLFKQFLQEKTFLNNVSPKTIRSYGQAFNSFRKHGGSLDKTSLSGFVVGMRTARRE